MGSSFDVDLIHTVGQAIGEECRAKSACPFNEASNYANVFKTPWYSCVAWTPLSILSAPRWAVVDSNRSLKIPHLNGTIAAAYINGLQSKGVSATIKHFATNDQEFERQV